MPLFNTTIASGITDRIAAIARNVSNTLIAARTASAPGDIFQRITGSEDYHVERDFLTPSYEFEQNLSGTVLLASNTYVSSLVNALDTHCSKTANTNFNTYLNNSGLQVSEYYAQLHGAVKNTQLTAHNVFLERDQVLATVTKVGAGNWTFASGQDLGTGGTATYDSATPITGEQLLIAALPSGVSTSNCSMSVSGLDDAGHVQWAACTFPNSINNAHVVVSATKKYRTVTNVSVTTDTGITNASVMTIVNKRERLISL